MKQAFFAFFFVCIALLFFSSHTLADDQPLNQQCSIPDVKFTVGCSVVCNAKSVSKDITVSFHWGKTNASSYVLVYWNLADYQKNPSHYDVKILNETSFSISNWPSGNPIGFKVAKAGACSNSDQYVYPTDPRGATATCNSSCPGAPKLSPTPIPPSPPVDKSAECSSANHTLNYSYINDAVYYGTWPTDSAGSPYNEQTSLCQSSPRCDETESGSNLSQWGPYNLSAKGNGYCAQKYGKTDERYCCVETLPPPPNPCDNPHVTREGTYCGSGIAATDVDEETLYQCKKDKQGVMQTVKATSCGTLGCVEQPGQDDVCASAKETTCGNNNQGVCVYSLDKSNSSLVTLDASKSCKASSVYYLFGYSCADLRSYSCDSIINEPYGSSAISEGKNTCFNNGSNPQFHMCCQPNPKPAPVPALGTIKCGVAKQGYCGTSASSCKTNMFALTDQSTCGTHQSNTPTHLVAPNVCCLPTVKDTNPSDKLSADEQRFMRIHGYKAPPPTATPTPKPASKQVGSGSNRVLGSRTINIPQEIENIFSALLHSFFHQK